ncbi:hypothetical protein BC835DRAFT_1075054 [Cytidiella melzeri]|nr:hypothetical protein BC835DRAFT_1075054 [Cytidiella melzeri]
MCNKPGRAGQLWCPRVLNNLQLTMEPLYANGLDTDDNEQYADKVDPLSEAEQAQIDKQTRRPGGIDNARTLIPTVLSQALVVTSMLGVGLIWA